MKRLGRFRHILATAQAAAFVILAPQAFAAPEIGHAITVEKTVSGLVAGKKTALVQDDAVFKDEVIETATESLARLKFLDDTLLFVGPSSAVKLDSFVYNPDNTASKLVIAASKGAFRFVSGKSAHAAYEIRTPYGSLGVSGTTLGFVIAGGRMIAVLKQGAMVVCPHARLSANLARCIPVTKPDMAVIVSKSGVVGPVPKSADMRDFGDLCGDLCKRLFPQ
ncbi:MAG: FecR domain-containing protein [Hyphomicrobiales bacterium]